MYQDTYIATGDGITAKLGELYAAVLPRLIECERLFAAIKQARGERVAMHTAAYAQRELSFEVAHLRMYLAVHDLHAHLQPLWDEAQQVRRHRDLEFSHSQDHIAIRLNNVVAAEELYDLGAALYWEYKIAHYEVHHFQVDRVFKLQDADPDCFIYDHGDATLAELTARFKPLHEQYRRVQALFEAIKRAKSNCVQLTDSNKALHLERERRLEASTLAFRHAVMPLHQMLEPLFQETHTVRSRENAGEFVHDRIAVRRLCLAAAEGLYKRAHALFYQAIEEQLPYPNIAELFKQEPANPRVFLMRDGVELDNPLPPAPYQTADEARIAGDKWVSWASGYATSVIVDTRLPRATAPTA